MTLRRGLLWLMLVSLGLSAVAGALAVLTASSDVIWRIIGTGVTAGVSAGLLLTTSLLLDKDKSRSAGLLGMTAVVLAFLLTLCLIWENGTGRGFGNEESVVFTLLAVLMAAPPAMFFLRIAHVASGKWASRVGVAGCLVAFVMMVVSSWWATPDERLWATACIVGASGILAAASLAGFGVNPRHWRWVGVGAAGIAMVLTTVGVWRDLDQGSFWLFVVWGLAVVVAHANLSIMCPLTSAQRWVRVVTIAAVVGAAALLDASAWVTPSVDWELANRGAGAAGVIAACGSLALLILARLNRKMLAAKSPPNIKDISLTCPWCERKQTVPLGESRCAHCGLRFRIAVEEPRCPNCEYLLYMLQSDRCPECGTPIVPQPAPV